MSEEKEVVEKKPKFENPLTRREMQVIGVLAVAIVGTSYGLGTVTANQAKDLKDLDAQKQGLARAEEAKTIEDQIKRAKLLRAQNKVWGALLPKVEAYFPPDSAQTQLSYIDLLNAISKVPPTKVLMSSESEPVTLEFGPDVAPEPVLGAEDEEEEDVDLDADVAEGGGEGGAPVDFSEDMIPEDLFVKYKEHSYKFKLLTTYYCWLRILQRLEDAGRFYRLKQVVVKEPPRSQEQGFTGADPSAVPEPDDRKKNLYSVEVEGELAAYSVVEFSTGSTEQF